MKLLAMIDPAIFQIMKVIVGSILGLLLSIIGFYTRLMIKEIKDELKRHEKRINEQNDVIKENRSLIEQNDTKIKANSERDSLNREFITKTLNEFKSFFSKEMDNIKRDIKELTKDLYEKQSS